MKIVVILLQFNPKKRVIFVLLLAYLNSIDIQRVERCPIEPIFEIGVAQFYSLLPDGAPGILRSPTVKIARVAKLTLYRSPFQDMMSLKRTA
ncbi:MAG TPA: hypothetical protein IGS17_16375 [Oscillatoriales cyanobacterium M59_W2019_021]|nr:MAG: hypothetical protein D6728_10390 [Cyanobacteria bacterium J055]HIK32742.1 hypothetical protein [Oscillatoriales cyanobacterium M4454_W2019_049]HIK52481.1 hypothetical protein [Oscillatoriales cyanobacterium M59_W2019_021]